jgi:hypothetical protein
MTIEQDQLTVTRRGLRQKEAMHFMLYVIARALLVLPEAIPNCRRLLTALAYGASVVGKSKCPPRNDISKITIFIFTH